MIVKVDGITIEQLREAYQIAAEVVARYGDAYLPVFNRLHQEMEKVKEMERMKSLALNVAIAKISPDSKE